MSFYFLSNQHKRRRRPRRRRRKKVSWTRASTTDVVLLLLLSANELPPLSTVVHQCTLTIYGAFLYIVRDSPCRFFACLFDSSPFPGVKERKGAPQNRILFKFSRRAECIFSPHLLLYFPDHQCRWAALSRCYAKVPSNFLPGHRRWCAPCVYTSSSFSLSLFFYLKWRDGGCSGGCHDCTATFTSDIAHFSNQFLAANNSLPRRGKFRNKILKTATVVGRKSETDLNFSSLFAQKSNTILLVAGN